MNLRKIIESSKEQLQTLSFDELLDNFKLDFYSKLEPVH